MDDVTAMLLYFDWDALEDVEDATGLQELRRTADSFVAKDENEAEEPVETRTLTSFAQSIVHLHETLQEASLRIGSMSSEPQVRT